MIFLIIHSEIQKFMVVHVEIMEVEEEIAQFAAK